MNMTRGREWVWVRQNQRMSDFPSDFADLGFATVFDYPAYDNGAYVVVDTVKDLEWTILNYAGQAMGKVSLDKYEAIRWADDYLEADLRVEAKEGQTA